MKCELCKKNEATVHLKQASDGKVREVHLCEECAAEKGFDVQSPLALTDFLFGLEIQSEGSFGQQTEPGGVDVVCPSCHMRRSDFRKTSRLGCAQCYETFSDELSLLFTEMQKGSQHVGKVPKSEKIPGEIASLRRKLDKAVASQNFEEAARLRDTIRGMNEGEEC